MKTENQSYSRGNVKLIVAASMTVLFTLIFAQCGMEKETYEEEVNLSELLPEGGIAELAQGHPDLRVTFVDEKNANVSAKFGEKYLRLDGIEDAEPRERIAKYVLQYLENPNKREDDIAKREAYNKLAPKKKMEELVARIRSRNPDFTYEWVGLGEGNVEIEYGDNSLIINGIENDGAKKEIAHGITQIQKDIDALGTGEQQ